jgi:hypothetical protein
LDALISIDPGASQGVALFVGGRLAWVGPRLPEGVSPARVVIERPGAVWKGTTRDVIALAWRGGRVEGEARAKWPGARVETVEPVQWKGSVPKTIHQPRILRKLDAQEARIAEACNSDQIDAIGIGLWALGRF